MLYNSIIIKYLGEICSSSCRILFSARLQNAFPALRDTDGYPQTGQITLSSPRDPRRYPSRKYLSVQRPYTLEITRAAQFVSSDFIFINILIKSPVLFRRTLSKFTQNHRTICN